MCDRFDSGLKERKTFVGMARLDQAVVLLTGAAGGIGASTTRLLLQRGAKVVAVDRDAEGLQRLVAEHGARVSAHVVDLSALGEIDALADELWAVHRRIDVLINNAGLTVHGFFSGMSAEEVDRVLDVDLRAPLHLTRAVLPKLGRGGHLVFVSSMAGLVAFPTQSTYSSAKFGLRGFAAALRIELAQEEIGVTTVLPATIATEFLSNAQSHDERTTEKLAALMTRFGTSPERVARAIVRGIERDRGTLRVGWDCWLLSALAWACPSLVPFVLRQVHRRRMLGKM